MYCTCATLQTKLCQPTMNQRHAPLLSQTGPAEDSVIDSLPEEVLARILGLLQPCQLHWVERVNTRLRNTVVHNNLWRAHCIRVCHNFEAVAAAVDSESLRQVLVDLRTLADKEALSSISNSSPPRRLGFTLVPFPSHSKSTRLPCGSPVLKPDSELTRSSPGAQVAPFWGPGLVPGTSADPNLLPASGTTHQSPSPSIITRLHQLCTGQRNLRTQQGSSKEDANASSSGGNKLWSFNTEVSEEVITSLFYKRLCWRLGACAAKESLISEALQASSTDRPEEHIRHVLNPSARMRGFMSACYWCSGPSDDPDSIETLDFKLAHPLCVIHEVALQPFKAEFQPGAPVYAPKRVRFHFARTLEGLVSAGQANSACTSTPDFPVEPNDNLQHFHLPATLCAGGFVRVELIGHVQRQQMDHRYYTCMLYVKVLGTPVYGFIPGSTQQEPASQLEAPHLSPVASRESSQTQFGGLQQGDAVSEIQQQSLGGVYEAALGDEEQKAVSQQQPSVMLKAVLKDPLLEAGGLHRVSEMGRLLLQSSMALAAASDDEEAEDGLHGDSDDGDFAQEQLEDLASDDDSEDDNDFDLAHGVGLQMGADLAHVPVHELLGGHIDGIDGELEEYPLMYE